MKTSCIATGDLFIKEVGGKVVIPLSSLPFHICVPVPGKDMNYCEFPSTYVLDWVAQTLLKFKCQLKLN